jgi:hypothetical protein
LNTCCIATCIQENKTGELCVDARVGFYIERLMPSLSRVSFSKWILHEVEFTNPQIDRDGVLRAGSEVVEAELNRYVWA